MAGSMHMGGALENDRCWVWVPSVLGHAVVDAADELVPAELESEEVVALLLELPQPAARATTAVRGMSRVQRVVLARNTATSR